MTMLNMEAVKNYHPKRLDRPDLARSAALIPEVAKSIDMRVWDLLAPDTLKATVELREGAPRAAYKYVVGPLVIWGATARILKRFLEIGYGARYPDTAAD
ncbi:MAG: hypothetical protein ACREUT_17240 [Steroidobacteraceae bacterium]